MTAIFFILYERKYPAMIIILVKIKLIIAGKLPLLMVYNREATPKESHPFGRGILFLSCKKSLLVINRKDPNRIIMTKIISQKLL